MGNSVDIEHNKIDNLSFHCSSLWIRRSPSLDALHCFSLRCQATILLYHPRYLLSSIDQSSKQHWLAVNDGKKIRLIDTLASETFLRQELIGHTGNVECLAWSPSVDHLFASGSQDKTVRV
jgi:WD40 repeat protein